MKPKYLFFRPFAIHGVAIFRHALIEVEKSLKFHRMVEKADCHIMEGHQSLTSQCTHLDWEHPVINMFYCLTRRRPATIAFHVLGLICMHLSKAYDKLETTWNSRCILPYSILTKGQQT